MLEVIADMYPKSFQALKNENDRNFIDLLAGTKRLKRYIIEGRSSDFLKECNDHLRSFNTLKEPYLLYKEDGNEMNNLSTLITETRNKKSMNIDNMSTNDIIHTINNEDMVVAKKVQEVLPSVEATVDITYNALKQGGRLCYVGAGSSGRIGVLDAVECPPTFSTSSDMVQAVIAGGGGAFQKAAEGAEDNPGLGEEDLKERHLSKLDVVIGIAASGRTPYVLGALQYAQELGAKTISLTSNEHSAISKYADVKIEV